MRIYADTSFLVGYAVWNDTNAQAATAFYEAKQDETWWWSPWHRVEVFNSIRQLTRLRQAKRALLVEEAKRVIRNLEEDVRCRYFEHIEADWRDVLRTSHEISLANAFVRECPATDLLHVAYAIEVGTDLFVTFDASQYELAVREGLNAVVPKLS